MSNIRYIATSSRSDQSEPALDGTTHVEPFGPLRFTFDYKYRKRTQKNGKYTYSSETIEDHTINQTHAGYFTNGLFSALADWADNAQERSRTGNDLAKALAVAFGHESDQDFAVQRGVTNPDGLDFSYRDPVHNPPEEQPTLQPIVMNFHPDQYESIYTEVADGHGVFLTYHWTLKMDQDPNCAVGFHGSIPQSNQATWYHADRSIGGPCDHTYYVDTGYGHPGTVTVTVRSRFWMCDATFYGTLGDNGSAYGVGPEPLACTRIPR